MIEKVEMELGGRRLTLETGVLAKQAGGAVVVRYGDTVILATAVASSTPKPGIDFLPLSVDYREKMYAAGKIPGGFFKREGRPTEKEILVSRLIDRPLRPLFSKKLRNDIQVLVSTLSYDPACAPDVISIIGASAALSVSNIPFSGPVGAVKIGRIDGKFIINPALEQAEKSDIELVMAGTADSIVMIESGSVEISEEEILEGIIAGHEEIKKIVSIQCELAEKAGKEKFALPAEDETPSFSLSDEKLNALTGKIKEASAVKEKLRRQKALKDLLLATIDENSSEGTDNSSDISALFHKIERNVVRSTILSEGMRGDGRDTKEIRPISIQTDVLPRTHGSVVFTRGETQALVVTTLGTASDEQRLDNIEGSSSKSFMLHYNFPPFCVGEARFSPGPGRREIGHGSLAERAVKAVLPSKEKFPYSIRVVSEILESNGSSSMASVCGASLSLMNSGVPLSGAVAGIAMGLVIGESSNQTAILSDITGQEDHLGDMDFKVAGTKKGITALQMDIKISGITKELLSDALSQAKEGRVHILEKMAEAISTHKAEMSVYAPRIVVVHIKPDKVRELIGPGGKVIRGIIDETGATINIEDDGTVSVASTDQQASARAIELINSITQDPEIGRIYTGKVKKVMDFGAFVEIVPGKDGLVHISQLADYRVTNVTDIVKEGDVVDVKVLDIDGQGKIKLSLKEAKKQN